MYCVGVQINMLEADHELPDVHVTAMYYTCFRNVKSS